MVYVGLCRHLLGFHSALHLKTFKVSYENAANGLTSKQGTHEKGKQRLEGKTKKVLKDAYNKGDGNSILNGHLKRFL